MTRPTHVLIAASGGLAAGEALAPNSPTGRCVVLLAAFAANEIPDKDRHAARGQKRSPTHWLITGLILALVAGAIAGMLAPGMGRLVTAGFLTGYWLHLVADGMTPEGCPLFGPFLGPVRLLPFRIRIVSGRPPAGWQRCPYVPVPEPVMVMLVLGIDVLVLVPALT